MTSSIQHPIGSQSPFRWLPGQRGSSGSAAALSRSWGFLGIEVPETASLAGGAWLDPPAVFPAGSEQAYAFSVDAPSATAQSVTFTLSGASPSDFEARVGNAIEQITSDGTFTVTLPVGQTDVSFGLIEAAPHNRIGLLGWTKRGCLHACALALLLIGTAPLSHAGNLTACIDRKVTFDGIAQLQYATVKATAGPRLYLYSYYPDHSVSENPASSPVHPYLVPGNAVAIGKECGEWDYVQYIGERIISKGWVHSRALTVISSPPLPKAPPVLKQLPPPKELTKMIQRGELGRLGMILDATYRFRLIRGKGVPVCEALLQRLNFTSFRSPPYCGIPENDSVPGFSILHRLPLSEKEIVDLAQRVNMFMLTRSQNHPLPRGPRDFYVREVQEGLKFGNLLVWRYKPEISVDNDGQKHNVVVWQGPAVNGVLGDVRCGEVYLPWEPPDGYRAIQMAFVIQPNGQKIDEKKTQELLGLPAQNIPKYLKQIGFGSFVSLGDSLGFLEYRGRYYMHTFGPTIPWNLKKSIVRYSHDYDNILSVLIRKSGRTRPVCEYRMTIVPTHN